jgi:hypothetical protein
MRSAKPSTTSGARCSSANAAKAFESAGAPNARAGSNARTRALKSLVGEFALELKKSEEILG